MKINVIMPMLGNGTRMCGVQNTIKPLMRFPDGDLFFIKALSSLDSYDVQKLILVVREEYEEEFTRIRDSLVAMGKCSECVIISHGETQSHYESFCIGLDYLRSSVDWYNIPLVVLDCDIYAELPVWEDNTAAAGLFTFIYNGVVPNKCFVKGWGNKVLQVAEKKRISNKAVFGAYLFRDTDLLTNIVDTTKDGEMKAMSDIYQKMIQRGAKVTSKTVYHPLSFGTLKEYKRLINKMQEQ